MAEARTTVPLIGQTIDTFEADVLPTTIDVLRLYFFYRSLDGWTQKDAVKKVANEVCTLWNLCGRLPISAERNIVRKVQAQVLRYRDVLRNAKRGGPSQQRKEATYLESVKLLFDISSKKTDKLMKNNDTKLFLTDQQTDRKLVISSLQKAHEQADQQTRMNLRKYRKAI